MDLQEIHLPCHKPLEKKQQYIRCNNNAGISQICALIKVNSKTSPGHEVQLQR